VVGSLFSVIITPFITPIIISCDDYMEKEEDHMTQKLKWSITFEVQSTAAPIPINVDEMMTVANDGS
jgi:hypothetical protein